MGYPAATMSNLTGQADRVSALQPDWMRGLWSQAGPGQLPGPLGQRRSSSIAAGPMPLLSTNKQQLMGRLGLAVDEVQVDDRGWSVSLDMNKLGLAQSGPGQARKQASKPDDLRHSGLAFLTKEQREERRLEELRVRFIKEKINRFRKKLELENKQVLR